MSRYRFVSTMKAEGFSVTAACDAAEVSASAFYAWCQRRADGPTDADWDEALLTNELFAVHRDHDAYGEPRMTAEVARRGFCANHKRIERLMRSYGIYAKDARRRRVRTTVANLEAPPLPDLVSRDFSTGAPGKRSCGDITYIPTGEGWLYLADVLDLGSRRIVGFAMDERKPTELVATALRMAADNRDGNVTGMVFHHDRGSQYMSQYFRRLCSELGVRQSVGRVASCHDNAPAESLWATLKRELVHRVHFATRDDARRAITTWIHRYNTVRLHSTIGMVPPIEWELRFACDQLQAA